MRRLILLAALGLAACNSNEPVDTNAVAEESSAEQVGPVNDITAIDAATGEAANMAADVNYSIDENEFGNLGNDANSAVAEASDNSSN